MTKALGNLLNRVFGVGLNLLAISGSPVRGHNGPELITNALPGRGGRVRECCLVESDRERSHLLVAFDDPSERFAYDLTAGEPRAQMAVASTTASNLRAVSGGD